MGTMDECEQRSAKRIRRPSDDKYDIEEAFNAQETGFARVDDNITFTAFNVDEELEEGHFDSQGTYIFRKQKDEITDWWIDNIDQSQLASVSKPIEDSNDEQPSSDASLFYKEIVLLMSPNETVSKAIQRLGKYSKSSHLKGKRKRNEEEATTTDLRDAKEKLSQLISLADRILQTGDTDIYEKSYEQIQYLNATNQTKDGD